MLEGRARTQTGPSPDLSQPVLFASAVIYGQVVIVLAGLITDVGPASRLARVADQRAVCVAMASCCEHVTGACRWPVCITDEPCRSGDPRCGQARRAPRGPPKAERRR